MLDPAVRARPGDDIETSLINREFHLLEYFLRNAPAIVTKYERLERVWGGGFDTDTKVVGIYIGYLRANLDCPCGLACIRTARGAGHRCNPSIGTG